MTATPLTRAEDPRFWEPLGSDGIARIRYEVGDIVNEDLARATIVELKALTPPPDHQVWPSRDAAPGGPLLSDVAYVPNQAGAIGQSHRLDPRPGVELMQERLHVAAHGRVLDSEIRRDRAVTAPAGHEGQDL